MFSSPREHHAMEGSNPANTLTLKFSGTMREDVSPVFSHQAVETIMAAPGNELVSYNVFTMVLVEHCGPAEPLAILRLHLSTQLCSIVHNDPGSLLRRAVGSYFY